MRGAHQLTLTIALLLAAATNLPAQSRVPWVTTWQEASALAQTHQRLVLIHFWSNNCPPCMRLEQAVYSRPEVIRAMVSNYVPLKVNVDANAELAQFYRVQQWPTDVIVTALGAELFRGPSSQDPNRYIATLDQVAAHTRVGTPFAGSPSTEIAAERRDSGTANRTSAFPVGPSASMPGSSPFAVSPAVQGGPYASSTMPTSPGMSSGSSPATTSSPTGATGPKPPAFGAGQAGQGNGYTINQFTGPISQQPTQPVMNTARPQNRAAVPGSPPRGAIAPAMPYGATQPNIGQSPGNPPTGNPLSSSAGNRSTNAASGGGSAMAAPVNPALDGYCPVTLIETEKWVKGNPQWGAVHLGRTYLFAGPEQQRRFMEDFNRYAPTLSGIDCVKYAEAGQMVDGKRAHGVFYRGQVYLFADEAALQKFWSAPERFIPFVQAAQLRQQTTRR